MSLSARHFQSSSPDALDAGLNEEDSEKSLDNFVDFRFVLEIFTYHFYNEVRWTYIAFESTIQLAVGVEMILCAGNSYLDN